MPDRLIHTLCMVLMVVAAAGCESRLTATGQFRGELVAAADGLARVGDRKVATLLIDEAPIAVSPNGNRMDLAGSTALLLDRRGRRFVTGDDAAFGRAVTLEGYTTKQFLPDGHGVTGVEDLSVMPTRVVRVRQELPEGLTFED